MKESQNNLCGTVDRCFFGQGHWRDLPTDEVSLRDLKLKNIKMFIKRLKEKGK